MFMAFTFAVLVASVPLAGGRLRALGGLRVRRTGLIMLGLAVQVLMSQLADVTPTVVPVVLHLSSYAIVGVALWANRALPGLLVLTVGALTNAAVIALNGGTLPASAYALRQAGLSLPPGRFTNSGVVRAPVLAWLGDIVATPSWLPFRNVMSVGDVAILVGAGVLLHTVCRSRLSGRASTARR